MLSLLFPLDMCLYGLVLEWVTLLLGEMPGLVASGFSEDFVKEDNTLLLLLLTMVLLLLLLLTMVLLLLLTIVLLLLLTMVLLLLLTMVLLLLLLKASLKVNSL